jgi:hypothetical protein
MCGAGWLGADCRDGRRRTTKDSAMERQGGPKRQETEKEVAKWPLPQPAAPSIPVAGSSRAEPSQAKRTPSPSQPASPPACLPAARPPLPARPSRQGLPPLPRAASLLPLPHFLLLSLCQTHLELFKPKYSAPSPSSQIPPQFKTSPSLALGGGEEGRG